MSEPRHRKSVHLVVKARNSLDIEFVEPGYKIPNNDVPAWVTAGHAVNLIIEIPSRHTYADWSRAYAQQGQADLKVYKELASLHKVGSIEDCHELHYLQMSIEKIARAYLLKRSRGDRQKYLLSHVAVGEFTKWYEKSHEHQSRFGKNIDLWKQVKLLAGAIEHLTPAIERQARPANVEYPWSDGTNLQTPSQISFLSQFSFPVHIWTKLFDVFNDLGHILAT